MPIQSSDFRFFKSSLTSDTTSAQNGGRESTVEIIDNVKGLFPDVPQTERTAGSTKLRKTYARIMVFIELVDPKICYTAPSDGDDFCLLQYTGSHVDTQDQIPSGARHYGVGTLRDSAALGATTLVVTLEHPLMGTTTTLRPFQAGDLVRISNQRRAADSGSSEYRTVETVTYDGGEATITLTAPGTTYAWDAATPIFISSVVQPGDILPRLSDVTVSSTGGTCDTGQISMSAVGVIRQTWTLTITNASTGAFRLDGDSLGGNVATGSTGADFTPDNAGVGAPYFTLPSTAWSGAWAAGDTLVITTTPGSVPLWEKRIIPAGAASIAVTGTNLAIIGESA
jgi:hypothetical protein